MAARVVLASRRFQKDYTQFLRKYTDLEQTLRGFLEFRATARPDQSYIPKDGRISGTKFWRCHLVHGKAIMIYQLHASEIRLVAIDDHNEAGNTVIRGYAKTLAPDDYYQFNIDAHRAKPASEPESTSEPSAEPEPSEASMSEAVNSFEPETVVQQSESIESEPVVAGNPLWDAKLVQFALERQLLYLPRPARPLIVFHLKREIIAPAGDVLVLDPVTEEVHHLSANELNAGYQPDAAHPATSLAEAISIAMQPVSVPQPPVAAQATPEPAQAIPEPVVPEPAQTIPEAAPVRPLRTTARKNNVGPQLGRLVMTMATLQRTTQVKAFDTATIAAHMPVTDRKSVSGLMVNAQNVGLVKKAGSKVGRGPGYVYCLTTSGERTSKALGDWPFTVVGLTPMAPPRQVAGE